MNTISLVGILNVTPDSFSDGGLYLDTKKAIAHADELFAQGAALVDVGAESTRPNAVALTPEQEWRRLEPVVKELLKKYPGKICVDSYHPETYSKLKAAAWGDFIINDVTGFNNPHMVKAAVQTGMPVIISHLPAKFGTDIQAAHTSEEPMATIEEVKIELLKREAELIRAGVKPENIILDPGIGFGKTMELNRELVEFAACVPDKTVMIGYSRKRFLGPSRMDLQPNLEAGRQAIAAGAHYLRVHDIKGHCQLLT